MLQERHLRYHTLLRLNVNRAPSSRLPREFIGAIEHYTMETANSAEKVSLDKIYVYRREIFGSPIGRPLEVTRILYSETEWHDDGIPLRCRVIQPPKCDSRDRCGYMLLALPLVSGGEDLITTKPSPEEPKVWWCMAGGQNHAFIASASPSIRQMRPRNRVHLLDHAIEELCVAHIEAMVQAGVKESFEDDMGSPRAKTTGDLRGENALAMHQAEEPRTNSRMVTTATSSLTAAVAAVDGVEEGGPQSPEASPVDNHRELDTICFASPFDLDRPEEWTFLSTSSPGDDDDEDSWSSDSENDQSDTEGPT